MLFLVIQIGRKSYALPSDLVVEVVPASEWKAAFQASAGATVSANYRGKPLSIVDLNLLTEGEPTRRRGSNSLVVVRDLKESEPRVALVAERASEVLRCPAEDFVEMSDAGGSPPWLGGVLQQGLRFIQQLRPEHIPAPTAPFDW